MKKVDVLLKIRNILNDKLRELPTALVDFKVDEESLLSESGGEFHIFHFKIEQYRHWRCNSMIKYDVVAKIIKIVESRLSELPSGIYDYAITDDYDYFWDVITTDFDVKVYQSRNLSDKEELLPCPFCGGSANIDKVHTNCDNKDHYYVYCTGDARCVNLRGAWPTRKAAVEAWNRRVC